MASELIQLEEMFTCMIEMQLEHLRYVRQKAFLRSEDRVNAQHQLPAASVVTTVFLALPCTRGLDGLLFFPALVKQEAQ